MKKLLNILCTLNVLLPASVTTIACSEKAINNHQQKTHHQEHKDNEEKSSLPKDSIVKKHIDEMEENLVANDLDTNGIDGSHLTVNNTIADAMDLIQEKILLDDPQAEDIQLKNAKITDFLTVGKNTIKISFKIANHEKQVTTHINGVQSAGNKNSNVNEEETKKLIITTFEKGLVADNLYGWDTIFDALNYFKNEAKKINPHINVKFSDKYITSRLGNSMFKNLENEIINLKDSAKSKDKSSLPVKEVLSAAKAIKALAFGGTNSVLTTAGALMGWGSAAVAVGVAGYHLTTWITKKLTDIKRTEQAFLVKASEKFELEFFFGDDIKEEFEETPIKKDNKFTVHATLSGIKPRSRENAKEIIEKETYVFNHPLTFEETLLGVEQHIKATMFPTVLDPKSKQQFYLKAHLKDKKQKTQKLKKGINEIKVVLKPQKTSLKNAFKRFMGTGNIDVTIKVDYK